MDDIQSPRGNHLKPNGLGGYVVRQSDLAAWSRCNLQKYYDDQAKHDPDAPQRGALSATEYGTIVHYAALVMERAKLEGHPDPLGLAISTFEHYWLPENIEQCPAGARRVTIWIARQTYGGLRDRGRIVLRYLWEKMQSDDSVLLALEYQFAVPLMVDSRLHTFTGTIDRLCIRRYRGDPYVSVDDYKTGRQPRSLRWNLQGSGYAYATWQPEFWMGLPSAPGMLSELEHFPPETIERLVDSFASRGQALHEEQQIHDPELTMAPRRFRWVNLLDCKDADGGWRAERDFSRFALGMGAYVRAYENEIFLPNMTGEICEWCPHQLHCAGTGIATMEEGMP